MNIHQVAGRHGSYATQFWRPVKSVYSSRASMRRATSKKAVDRRLVLPLDTHNWLRALEVLGARYARLGRTADHYQRVIRDMVGQTAANPTSRRNITEALDRLRSHAYAGEIPTSLSLWVTLVWAYCSLQQSENALECLQQAHRRYTVSSATGHHMAEMVFAVLCQHGRLDHAKLVMEKYLDGKVSDVRSECSEGVPHRQCLLDKSRIKRLLAEAAARDGNWVCALQSLQQATQGAASSVGCFAAPTVNSIFLTPEVPASSRTSSVAEGGVMGAPLGSMCELSHEARRGLLLSLARDGQCDAAVKCWIDLYGDWRCGRRHLQSSPPVVDFQIFMNCLGAQGRWHELLHLFSVYYLGHTAEAYLLPDPLPSDMPPHQVSTTKIVDDVGPSLGFPLLPLSSATVSMAFGAFPRRTVEVPLVATASGLSQPSSIPLDRFDHAQGIVRLLDDLLLKRDDMQMTDSAIATVGPALLQLGQWDRALHLLRHTPMFSSTPSRGPLSSEAHNVLKGKLAGLVYHLHSSVSLEAKCFTICYFPFLFPKEVFRGLPTPQELPAHFQEIIRQQKASGLGGKYCASSSLADGQDSSTAFAMGDNISDEDRLARQPSRSVSSVRPSRPFYISSRTAVQLTESQEQAMRSNFVLQHTRRSEAFEGSPTDAERDPRPIPKGLHDQASGWNFYGRGGEMVFANSRRTPHPFSMQPKVMRSLGNPYRGWNPRQNSSWAHRENVVKWNGKSAV